MIWVVREVCTTLRQVLGGASGLDAYERYLDHWQRAHPDQAPLTREEFFCRELNARWSGIQRCC
jgi:uncharacterized short protein YbdD (DUF466 family)